MRWPHRTIALLQIVMIASPSYAVDVEFGAEGLPVLMDEADSVAISSRIELLEMRDSVFVYSATIDSVIAGRAEIGSRALFAVPRYSALEEGDLAEAAHILFLTGPIDSVTVASLMGRAGGTLFWLTGGSYGRIDSTRERVAAVRSYDAFEENDRKFPWVRTQLDESDELLQRSALIELAKAQYASDADKYTLLGAAAVNRRSAESTKDLALDLLQISESPRALPALRDVAVSDATTDGGRLMAIRSIGGIEGGDIVLRELEQNPNPTIRDLAATELARQRGEDPWLPSWATVLAGLRSADPLARAQAIHDLRRTAVTENTIPVVAALIDASASTNPGERVTLIDHLAALNTVDSAATLASVARDQKQPETVRNAAIIALAQMDPRVSLEVLRGLATGLEEGTLRQLAETLVNQP